MDSSHVVEGFLKSWGMILASEIGDKTFFIAAIMAMKHSRSVVNLSALRVWPLMHVLCPPLEMTETVIAWQWHAHIT